MSQTSKTVSILQGVVLPALTAVVTIVLFFVLRTPVSEHFRWHLFIFNMLYTVFLELILFGWIGFLYLGDKSATTSVFKIVSGITAVYYVIVGVVIMLIYNLALSHGVLPARYYYIIILVITLIWILVAAILLRTDVQDKEKDQIKTDQTKEIANVVSKMKVLASRFSTLQSIHGAKGENAVDLLYAEFKGLTPNNAENQASMSKLNSIIEELDQLLDEAETVPDEKYVEAAGRVKLYAKKTIGKVEQIKLDH